MHFIFIRSSIDMYEYKYEYMNIHNDNTVDSSQKRQTLLEQLEKAKPHVMNMMDLIEKQKIR